ncbi:hypothetical protein [Caballeronia concitans]|nr:hypothetical protein [Caballeronia concitans]
MYSPKRYPPVGDTYWTVLAASLPKRVSDLFQPATDGGKLADRIETSISEREQTNEEPTQNETKVEIGSPRAGVGDIAFEISDAVGTLMASSMETTEALLKIMAELDRVVLAIGSAMSRRANPELRERALAVGKVFIEALSDDSRHSLLTGDDLVDGPAPANTGHAATLKF